MMPQAFSGSRAVLTITTAMAQADKATRKTQSTVERGGTVAAHGDASLMAAYSILYLGRPSFGADYLERLERSPLCLRLYRCDGLPDAGDMPADVDLVLLEAGPGNAALGQPLTRVLRALSRYPWRWSWSGSYCWSAYSALLTRR